MDGLASPSDLGALPFENLCRQRLATPMADFQNELKCVEIVSGGGQVITQLMA